MSITWRTEKRKLSSLNLRDDNPRFLTAEQEQRLRKSLRKFGYSQLIEVNPDGTVLDGHQRTPLMVAMEEFGAGYEVEVRIPSRPLTQKEWQEYTALKHEGAAGSWDFEALKEWDTEKLLEWGFDEVELEAAGFELGGEEPPAPEPQIDRAAELQEKWQVQRGQVWEVPSKSVAGKCHRVMCGDSTDEGDVERLRVDAVMMVTDPPYGVQYEPLFRERALGAAVRRAGVVANDSQQSWENAFAFFGGDIAYVWHADKQAIQSGLDLIACKFEIKATIIWRKPHSPYGQGHYNYQHEPCWYAVRRNALSHWRGNHKDSTVWDIHLDETVKGEHGTQKPLECMARPIRNHNGDVYDPFLGSGTTIVACEQTKRIGYGMEIEPKYCAVTLERLSQMGLEPRLAAQPPQPPPGGDEN